MSERADLLDWLMERPICYCPGRPVPTTRGQINGVLSIARFQDNGERIPLYECSRCGKTWPRRVAPGSIRRSTGVGTSEEVSVGR